LHAKLKSNGVEPSRLEQEPAGLIDRTMLEPASRASAGVYPIASRNAGQASTRGPWAASALLSSSARERPAIRPSSVA
jgi:hypothetical protein